MEITAEQLRADPGRYIVYDIRSERERAYGTIPDSADGVIIAQFPRLVKGFAKKSRAVALQLCFPTTAEGINRRYTNEGGAPGQLVHECADDGLIACIAVDIGADERHIYEVVGIIE